MVWTDVTLNRDDPREQKRMAVLRTGARLFNARGFDRTSLDDIASELNVSKRTLYYYVKNKDDILFECSRLALEFMQEATDNSKNLDMPPLDRLAIVMRSYMDLLSTSLAPALSCRRIGYCPTTARKYSTAGGARLIRPSAN